MTDQEMREFFDRLPIIIGTENISYSCGVKKANECVWENIYQAFKARLISECYFNIFEIDNLDKFHDGNNV